MDEKHLMFSPFIKYYALVTLHLVCAVSCMPGFDGTNPFKPKGEFIKRSMSSYERDRVKGERKSQRGV